MHEACDSQEQERRTQLEFDDESPDDDSAALVVSPFSSSDTDVLLPFKDERLCEKSRVREEACEFDLSLDAVEKREKETQDSRLIMEKESSSLKQLLNGTMMLVRPFLILKKSVAFKWLAPRTSWWKGMQESYEKFGHFMDMPQPR